MNYTVFYSLLLGYAFVALFLGRQSASKIQTEEDYFLGGRKVGFFGLTMTLVATQFGGGAIVGGAEAAYQYGWLGVSYSFGIALGFIILALGMGGRLRALNVRTVPEIFEKDGAEAITNYKVMHKTSTHSLIQYSPKTGRTHQLRVHSQYLGCPIVGDIKYGACEKGQKLHLHAHKIQFMLKNEEFSFETDMPDYMNLKILRSPII